MNESSRELLLTQVLAGRITPDSFFRKTKAHWEAAAAYLLRRWKAPAWYEHDELVQEVMFGAWIAIWKFEEGRGKTIQQYVDWNALDYGKKHLHKARGAGLHGSPDKRQSRFEIPFSALADEDGANEWLETISVAQPLAPEMIDARRRWTLIEKNYDGEAAQTIARMLAETGNDAEEVTEAVCSNATLLSGLGFVERFDPNDVARLVARLVCTIGSEGIMT